jgi:hypothetical protein
MVEGGRAKDESEQDGSANIPFKYSVVTLTAVMVGWRRVL